MDIAAQTDAFVSRYNGTHIDEDGYYGAQCWDVSARFAREVVGCPSFPTGSGGAEGLFRIFADPIPQFFDRIANDPRDPNQLPRKGDVIVFMASFSPPWGHTGVCISADSSGVTMLEQNGNNPGGVAYIKKRGWTGVSGWLRPKRGVDMAEKINVDTSRIIAHGILARNGLDGRAYALDGSAGDPWVGGDLSNQFIQDVFLSPEARQWRDSQDPNSINGINARLKQAAIDAKRPTSDDLQTVQSKLDEAVKVNGIKDGEITRLNGELAKAGAAQPTEPGQQTSVDITIKQAIRILFQTVKDAISGK